MSLDGELRDAPARRGGAERFFDAVISGGRWILPILLLVPFLFAIPLATLEKDMRSDAFIADDNPALAYRDVIKERFGLEDPMLIAVVAPGERGVFRGDVLAPFMALTDAVRDLENVLSDEVLGLSTASAIESVDADLIVEPLLESVPRDQEQMDQLQFRVRAFPLIDGSLVSSTGEALLLIVQLEDSQRSESTYRALVDLVDKQRWPEGVAGHVAGEGAVTGYLGAYVDADARILNPIAAVIILASIALAFKRWLPPLLAILMIGASVSAALGTMALLRIPFYVVTNAMPVILIGIAVADTIHVCNRFYLKQSLNPSEGPRAHSVSTMLGLWRPITITSATTIAGFLGLYFASEMPPFKYFGLFTAVGVFVAWLYSLLCLPIALSYARSQAHSDAGVTRRPPTDSALGRFMKGLGTVSTTYPKATLLFYLILAVAGTMGASKLHVDDDRVGIFHPSEKIAIANAAIETYIGGTGTLDIVIETGEPEGVFDPEVLKAIDALQAYGEALDEISGSRSIVDYLKQMNSALADDRAYVVPDSQDLALQYMLLYSFAGDPSDFDQLVDYERESANVRFSIVPSDYRSFAPVVEELRSYAQAVFEGKATASLSGRVSLDYDWLRAIGDSHAASVAISVLMVLLVSTVSFRSLAQGFLSLLPVAASVLAVYAVMALANIPLGVGTSMFAAVAIGLGVDFSIHTISRLAPRRRGGASLAKVERRAKGPDRRSDFYSGTGRALALNFLAVAGGFGVLMLSEVSQLADFGLIVMTAMGVSFFASVTLLPACYALKSSGG